MAPTIITLLRKYPVSLNENLEYIMTALNIGTNEKLQKSHMQRAIDNAVLNKPEQKQIVMDIANGLITEHKSKPTGESVVTCPSSKPDPSQTPQPDLTSDPNTDFISNQAQSSNTDLTANLQSQDLFNDTETMETDQSGETVTRTDQLPPKRKLDEDNERDDNNAKIRLVPNHEFSINELMTMIHRDCEDRKKQLQEMTEHFEREKNDLKGISAGTTQFP